ncbi:hypothetical protein, partial [Ancylomarina salipaludis]|uniref:hypothetical protein n=1 Tax=Ancylomarina salipaludis TaxID=2501299 RepID=UPI0013E8F868
KKAINLSNDAGDSYGVLKNDAGKLLWQGEDVYTALNANKSNVDWTAKELRAFGNLRVDENGVFAKLIQLNNNQSIQGQINGQSTYGNMLAMGTDNYAQVGNCLNTEGVKLYSKGNQLKLSIDGNGSTTYGNHSVTGEVRIDTTRLAKGLLCLNSDDWIKHTAGANEGWEIVSDGTKDLEILRNIGIINHRDTTFKGVIGTAPFISGIGGKGTWRISQDANAELDNLDLREGLTCNTFTN